MLVIKTFILFQCCRHHNLHSSNYLFCVAIGLRITPLRRAFLSFLSRKITKAERKAATTTTTRNTTITTTTTTKETKQTKTLKVYCLSVGETPGLLNYMYLPFRIPA